MASIGYRGFSEDELERGHLFGVTGSLLSSQMDPVESPPFLLLLHPVLSLARLSWRQMYTRDAMLSVAASRSLTPSSLFLSLPLFLHSISMPSFSPLLPLSLPSPPLLCAAYFHVSDS